MRATCLLVHAHPSNYHRYEAALGAEVYPVNSTGSQFSAGYDERTGIAAKLPKLTDALAKYAPKADHRAPVVLVGFSAGCWAVRAWLRDEESRRMCTAAVLVDGYHRNGETGGADPAFLDGDQPHPALFEFARLCMREPGKRVMIVTHSEIDPISYASTTESADVLIGALGLERAEDGAGTGDVHVPGFHVVRVEGRDAAAHTRQQAEVGPGVCEDHVAPLLRALELEHKDTEPTQPAVPSASIGVRLVARMREWMERENPPSPATKRQWLLRCERGGRRIWSSMSTATAAKLNHCAATATALAHDVLTEGETVPFPVRAAAKELVEDAKRSGAWLDVDDVRSGAVRPSIGDLAIYDRSQPGRPETAWWGHVDVVTAVRADSYGNIGANEGPRGEFREELSVPYSHDRLLGFVQLPQLPQPPELPSPPAPPASHWTGTELERWSLMLAGLLPDDAAEAAPWFEIDGR